MPVGSLTRLMLVAIWISPTAWLFTWMEARFKKVNVIPKEIVDRLPAKPPAQ